ncbi:ABC transporter permease [Demequina capsici]|uniref:ABC transporter permease n=1 Tax=Demequina capsici TaxID=3075620 RepID=A0AA96F7I7_9MICO|nr:ABC transporter permease [Demequina sp. OYTSA14]WNM24593.1 ABC transporter permease [Demequina sp. OYTSA14]
MSTRIDPTTRSGPPRATAAATAHRPPADGLAGLRTSVAFMVRRNRVRLLVWFVVIVGLFAYVGDYYRSIFTTQQALDDFAKISDNPGIRALTGLAAAPNTLGGAVWTKIWMTCALSLALGIVFLVTRNGRADEELGRAELLRSRMLGNHASAVATWTVLAVLSVAIGLFVAVSSILLGLDPDGAGTTGSWVVGASLTGVGLVSVGVGALAGQLASTSRGANSLGAIVVIGFYVLRMIGDLGGGALTWASPFGWGQAMAPWGANRWWPLGLMLLLAAALLGSAWLIEERRDHGAGLLPDRAGRGGAPRRYASPVGLALRLQRGPLIGWSAAVVLSALLFGSVVDQMNSLLSDSGADISALLQGTGIDALLGMLCGLIALLAAVFAVQSTTQLRADEASGIIEPQLAGAVSRTRWALQRLAIPLVGAALLLLVGGWLMGAGYGSTIGDSSQGARLAGATVAYLPAVLVIVGIAVMLFGYLPRLAVALSWALVGALWMVMIIGDALHLPAWALNLMPFSATPALPAEPMTWTPLVVMTMVGVGLVWAGLARFVRRDIQVG